MYRTLTCLVVYGLALFAGHPVRAEPSFRDAYDLSVRIGRGDLTDEERADLAAERHLVFEMAEDRHTGPLVRWFGELPDTVHEQLLREAYLKWDYADIHEPGKKMFRDMVEINIHMTHEHRRRPVRGFSVEALERSQVGLVIVPIPGTAIRYVSLFILWPDLPHPTWVTLVNVKVLGTPAYFEEHAKHLMGLRFMPNSSLPW